MLLDAQLVADAAHGLEPDRIGRVLLDLAAKAIDLDVDRALADIAVLTGQLVTGDRFTGALREDRHDVLFAIRQLDRFGTLLQFAARDEESVGAEHDLFDLRLRRRRAAP